MSASYDHAAVVLNLLRSAPPQGDDPLAVYDGYVAPGTPGPYVLVYLVSVPDVEPSSMTFEQDVTTTRIICHCVGGGEVLGGGADAARAVAARVEAALLNVTPEIPDREVWPIYSEGDAPDPDPDSSLGVTVVRQLATYRIRSKRVTA